MTTRWGRLVADLAAAGIAATIDENSYAESLHGRPRFGVSRSVTIHRPGTGNVRIADRWWNKNPDVWVGWEVWTEDREGIVTRSWRWTKKRSEVIAAVREVMA